MKRVFQSLNKFANRWFRHLLALPVFFLLFLCTKLIYSSYHNPISDSDYKKFLFSDYKLFGVTIPKDLNFCGEKVPLDNFGVKKELEKQFWMNAFNQPQTLILHKKAGRYFPLIEPIMKKNGVPDDFKYVAMLESGLTNSTAGSTAAGFWGLMIPVAQGYGLEVDDQVDERFNIEKATDVACKIFKAGYKKYKNWTLSAASYDMGTGALDKQMEKQGVTNYYDLDLNSETAMYVYRLLAFKEIISRPEAYGYKLSKRELFAPIPTYVVKVDSSITDLNAFAISQSSTVQILKTLNPWLLKNSLRNPEHKTYEILFPRKGVKLYGMDPIDSLAIVPVKTDSLKRLLPERAPDTVLHITQ
jgi:membrane-bound lytic murein transglycosylase D